MQNAVTKGRWQPGPLPWQLPRNVSDFDGPAAAESTVSLPNTHCSEPVFASAPSRLRSAGSAAVRLAPAPAWLSTLWLGCLGNVPVPPVVQAREILADCHLHYFWFSKSRDMGHSRSHGRSSPGWCGGRNRADAGRRPGLGSANDPLRQTGNRCPLLAVVQNIQVWAVVVLIGHQTDVRA